MTLSLSGSLAAQPQGFAYYLPTGFVRLPLAESEISAESFAALTVAVGGLFGLPPDGDETAQAAVGLAALGAQIGDQGVDTAAMGFYRSPEASRPIAVLVTGNQFPSDHESQETAVASLLEVHGTEDHSGVDRISLPAGPAVAVVDDVPQYLQAGESLTPLLQRRVTAWIPDRAGTMVAVISVVTNSWRDWEHVCRLALEIFRSLGWETSPD